MNFGDKETKHYKELYKLGLFETADIKFSYTTLYPTFDNDGHFKSIGYTMTVEIQFKTDK